MFENKIILRISIRIGSVFEVVVRGRSHFRIPHLLLLFYSYTIVMGIWMFDA